MSLARLERSQSAMLGDSQRSNICLKSDLDSFTDDQTLMEDLLCAGHCGKWWGKDTHSPCPDHLPSFTQPFRSFTQPLSAEPAARARPGVCILAPGFAVGLPEKTELKVKNTSDGGTEREEGSVPPEWTIDMGESAEEGAH